MDSRVGDGGQYSPTRTTIRSKISMHFPVIQTSTTTAFSSNVDGIGHS